MRPPSGSAARVQHGEGKGEGEVGGGGAVADTEKQRAKGEDAGGQDPRLGRSVSTSTAGPEDYLSFGFGRTSPPRHVTRSARR